jgi:para-aminobenzoate synthetase component 1
MLDCAGDWLDLFPAFFLRLAFPEHNPSDGYESYDSQSILAISFHNPLHFDSYSFARAAADWPDNKWWFGNVSYEAGLFLNGITSIHANDLQHPAMTMFFPDLVIAENQGNWTILFSSSHEIPERILNIIHNSGFPGSVGIKNSEVLVEKWPSHEDYASSVSEIRKHLQRGDIYELNYCFAASGSFRALNFFEVFKKLIKFTYAPFSTLAKFDRHVLISASPERFMKSDGQELMLQPMKGTARRFPNDPLADAASKAGLSLSEKERAENVMIVDLSRNDLARFSGRGVTVPELFGLRSLANVYQLVSTINAPLPSNLNWIELFKSVFPPGSMTGAPKKSAMLLIDRYEGFFRGCFSGITGFAMPERKFDFSVVIRSIIINTSLKKWMVPAGSAITLLANSNDEYRECMLKLKPMLQALCLDEKRLWD